MIAQAIPAEIQDYIDIVEGGETPVCKEQSQCVELVKRVWREEKLVIDYERINAFMRYQKYFPFDLLPWEKFCFVLHNCVFKPDGNPRWPDLFILCGRGAGKNGYLSFEGFCQLTPANGVSYYDIDICATSEDQARTSFDELYDILENPKHRDRFKKNFYWNKTEIINRKTRSKLRYRTNNAAGKDGLRSGSVFFDEVHAYMNWDNINVFTTGLGKKPHPRRTYVTTNGDVRDGVLDQLINKANEILQGAMPDAGFLPFICRLDRREEVDDPKLWAKANPSLPYSPTLFDEMLREYQDYRLDPVTNSAFMTKRMNIPVGNRDREVTSWENIARTNRELPDLEGKTCVCGIDYGMVTDMVSAFLLFRVRDVYCGLHHSWFCNRSRDKERIKLPLGEMAQRGLLTIVDDVEIHPSLPAQWIERQGRRFDIVKIAIDSFRYALVSRALREIGYEAREKKVWLVRPSDIMRVQPKIDSVFATGRLVVGDDPLFRWAVNNAKLEAAPNNNFKYGKIEPKSRKTDPFMAFVASMCIEEEIPEEQELVFFDPILF